MEKLQEELTKLDKGLTKLSDSNLASTYVHIYTVVDDLKKTMDSLKEKEIKEEKKEMYQLYLKLKEEFEGEK